MLTELFTREEGICSAEELINTPPGFEKCRPFRLAIHVTPLARKKSKGQRVAARIPVKIDKKRMPSNFFCLKKFESRPVMKEFLTFVGARRTSLFGGVDFFAMRFDFAESVDWFVLRFVVGARHDFAEEAHRNELNATNEKRNRKQHQRAVLGHDGHVVVKLLEKNVGANEQTGACPSDAEQAEELQRPRGIVQKKLHHQQIEKDANRAADSVIRFAGFALEIL